MTLYFYFIGLVIGIIIVLFHYKRDKDDFIERRKAMVSKLKPWECPYCGNTNTRFHVNCAKCLKIKPKEY